MAAVAETHHDENGLIWPMVIAPYEVVLTVVKVDHEESMAVAEQLYDELSRSGVEVLLDDRPENPGVKFNDADLIGLPVRLTVGDRSLKKGAVEVRLRNQEDKSEVAVGEVVGAVRGMLESLTDGLLGRVGEVEYRA